jgi:flagellar motor switch protein FliN/FliY
MTAPVDAATMTTDAQAFVTQAAEAALLVLPLHTPGTITDVVPASEAPDLGEEGTAIAARFAGAASGTAVVVVNEAATAALLSSPEGALDPVDALRPALETAVATLGPCTLEAGVESEPATGLAAIAGGAVAVVTDADGEVIALIGFTTSGTASAPAPGPQVAAAVPWTCCATCRWTSPSSWAAPR